jgi:eukaryotic-like serine/threonine-protein kinase
MNPERWQRVKAVFDGALALAGDQQPGYLAQNCEGDPELRSEVETLLHHHEQAAAAFLDKAMVDLEETGSETDAPIGHLGRRVGVYQILEEIGQGGMGQVYRAARVDGLYEKQVAVKFVRGGCDRASVVERFGNERQILASLDHPNIARLLDGGTSDDGVPYLVMELIKGTPIDRYCDEQALSVDERLLKFEQICSAVQYAHQRLVIHRDIKPSNVLATQDGTPKLLDFGIAKIIDPAARPEVTAIRAMTPEYASPEQVMGEPITTATDVYSLGVVLYQLLTGRSPYPRPTRSSHELARAVCEHDPLRPSSIVLDRQDHGDKRAGFDREPISSVRESSPARLHRRLVGDLDNIVLMALRKEPQRRYASVEQFAEDIRRHLKGLPVAATRSSWTYRAGKFVTRHIAGVAATLVIALTLAAGMTLTLREKRIAERRFNDVRKLANSLIFEIDDSIRDLPGSTSARKLLVTRALEYLDGLSREAKGDVSLERELATAYDRVGDVLGHPFAANLGDTPGALESYKKALAIRESLASAHPGDEMIQGELVRNYLRIANTLQTTADLSGALDALLKALPIAQRIAAGSSDSAVVDQLAGVHYFTAGLLVRTGDRAGALASYRQAQSIRTAALQGDSQSVALRSHLAADYIGMSRLTVEQGDRTQAIQMQGKAIQILEQLTTENPDSATLREYLGEATSQFALLQQENGDAAASLTVARRAHQIFADLLQADAKNVLARTNYGFSDSTIGKALLALGEPTEAAPLFQDAIATFEAMSPATSSSRYVRSGMADAYTGMGDAMAAMAQRKRLSANESRQNWREARTWYDKSLVVWADKQKRAELESGELSEQKVVASSLAKCDAILTQAPRSPRN